MPLIKEARIRLNRPAAWTNFEYLYNELKKREQKPENQKHKLKRS